MNWIKIVTELCEMYTTEFLAGQADLDATTIRRLRSGFIAEPKHLAGSKLLSLWMSREGNYAEDAML